MQLRLPPNPGNALERIRLASNAGSSAKSTTVRRLELQTETVAIRQSLLQAQIKIQL